jgi:hypothetical protein
MKFVKRDWKWLAEEANGELYMGNSGTAKATDRQLLHFRIAAILKKFMSSKMDGWFILGRMIALMFSTKILILAVFERQDMNDEQELKQEIGGESIKRL